MLMVQFLDSNKSVIGKRNYIVFDILLRVIQKLIQSITSLCSTRKNKPEDDFQVMKHFI